MVKKFITPICLGGICFLASQAVMAWDEDWLVMKQCPAVETLQSFKPSEVMILPVSVERTNSHYGSVKYLVLQKGRFTECGALDPNCKKYGELALMATGFEDSGYDRKRILDLMRMPSYIVAKRDDQTPEYLFNAVLDKYTYTTICSYSFPDAETVAQKIQVTLTQPYYVPPRAK